jgi:hypothetical protein
MSQKNLSDEFTPEQVADYVLAFQFGLSLMERNQSSFTQLKRAIEVALENNQLFIFNDK